MDPVIGSGLASAAGDLGSTLISGSFNRKEAKKNREFQARMDNTKYRRAARDMEAAGLNRILAIGNPGGAPSGATASMGDAKVGSSYQAGSSAKAQRDVAAAEKVLVDTKAKTEQEQQQLLAAQADAIRRKVEPEIANLNAQASSALVAAKRGSGMAELSSVIADIIKGFRNEKPGNKTGIIPKVLDILPETVLGTEGVNSARSAGKRLYYFLHGTPEEQQAEREANWKRQDAKSEHKKKPGPSASGSW